MWLYSIHLLEIKTKFKKTWTSDENWTFTTNWDALISNLYDPSRWNPATNYTTERLNFLNFRNYIEKKVTVLENVLNITHLPRDRFLNIYHFPERVFMAFKLDSNERWRTYML
jgi:hypothetical protein